MPRTLHDIPGATAPGEAGVAQLLTVAAAEVRRLWQAAIEAGDFAATTRWVDAGQAVHRALVAVDSERIG